MPVGLLLFAFLIAAILVLFVMLIAQIAENKGRSPVNWLLIALVTSPLIALLLLLILPPVDGPGGGGFRGVST